MTEKTSKASGKKKEIVKALVTLLESSPIIGIVNMEGLPAAQLQKISAQLRDKMRLFMTKKRLIALAMAEVLKKRPDLEKIKAYISGMPALLFTNENPFALYKLVKRSKTSAPAKPGQKAPKDIVVKAGQTPFTPGPIISELAAVGIKAGVEGGKVAIKADSVVAKEGQEISPALASILSKLGIEPMEIGLNIVAIYENGVVYPKDVLDVDETRLLEEVGLAGKQAINLATEIGFLTDETIELMLQKAALEEIALLALVKFPEEEKNAKQAVSEENKEITAEALLAQAEKDPEVVAEKQRLKEQKIHKQVEELYEELKKKGTLREAN
ncbi:MAG: 50S ribosomal protein L10 [Candidatus Woesearchaeota archaeon]